VWRTAKRIEAHTVAGGRANAACIGLREGPPDSVASSPLPPPTPTIGGKAWHHCAAAHGGGSGRQGGRPWTPGEKLDLLGEEQ
jgi:hypothetical protein